MNHSLRKDVLHATGVILAASVATFAVAVAVTMTGPAFAASQDYRFEVAQVASAGPGKSDVTVRLVRAADGTLVADADLSAMAATTSATERAGYRRFQVETATVGSQTLQLSAKVPGRARIERTFNTSIKATLGRKVRGADKVVTGSVIFDAQ
ncbi:MAG: hypothetical protein ACT4O6_14555 [Reyranella sp.]